MKPVEALVIIDVQAGHIEGAGRLPGAGPLVETLTGLLEKARANGALVVHVQNDGPAGKVDEPGTPGWELQLPAAPTEIVIRKRKADAFDGTDLAGLLTQHGVRSMAITGVMSEMCVSATARTALALGFRVVLPHDAHASNDIPLTPGFSDQVPAATVSRVAEWALLGNGIELIRTDVDFTSPHPQ